MKKLGIRELKSWLVATERCLKQEHYGSAISCELCRRKKYMKKTCDECIFFYAFNKGCGPAIFSHCRETNWSDKRRVRRYLREIKKWLEKKIKETGK